jgi:predicted MFS family arabinose efflux permease
MITKLVINFNNWFVERSSRQLKAIKLASPGVAIVAVGYGLARYAYGLFLPNIKADFQLSLETLGIIASSSYISYLLATVMVPTISSRRGFRLPVILGGLFAMIGMIFIGLAHNLCVLTLGFFIAGASPGLSYPPLSDAVVDLIETPQQSRTLTIINSGTSFGVILAGPIALLAGQHWRIAWFIFAAIALLVTIWNAKILPKKKGLKKDFQVHFRQWNWFNQTAARPLLFLAYALGFTTSVYWTFSVALIVKSNPDFKAIGQLFWTIVGISGIFGAFAGDLISYYGFRKILTLNIAGLAFAIFLLALFSSQWVIIIISAILFGAIFIMITGLLGVWSINVFSQHPSLGFGATFFLITAGQLMGPSIMGFIATTTNLTTTFYIAAAMTGMLIFIRPHTDRKI